MLVEQRDQCDRRFTNQRREFGQFIESGLPRSIENREFPQHSQAFRFVGNGFDNGFADHGTASCVSNVTPSRRIRFKKTRRAVLLGNRNSPAMMTNLLPARAHQGASARVFANTGWPSFLACSAIQPMKSSVKSRSLSSVFRKN